MTAKLEVGDRVRLLIHAGPGWGNPGDRGTVVGASDDGVIEEAYDTVYTVRADPRPAPPTTTEGFAGDGGPPPPWPEPRDWWCQRHEIEPLSAVDRIAELLARTT